MSVTYRPDKPDQTAELQKEIKGVKAAGDSIAALLSLTFKTQIVTDRATKTNVISDKMILASVGIVTYDAYKDAHEYKTVGEIITSDGLYFEVIAPHKSNAAAYPVATTFAYYRHVELTAKGTLDDPIPYPETAGVVVNVKNGLYYSYKGVLYLAKLDMPDCVWPPDTVGLWQWEKV